MPLKSLIELHFVGTCIEYIRYAFGETIMWKSSKIDHARRS